MQDQSKIACPACGVQIDVQGVLYHQLEEEIKKNYGTKLAEEKQKFESQQKELNLKMAEFEEKRKKENELFNTRLQSKLKEEYTKIEASLKSKIEAEQSEQLKVLHSELNEKSEKLKDLNRTLAEIEKLKREKEEMKESILADAQKSFNQKLIEEKERLEAKLKANLEVEHSGQLKVLQSELNEKSEKLKDLNRSLAEVEKLKREKDELKEAIEAETQKTFTLKLNEERERIRKAEQDKNELHLKELQKQLEDQRKLTEEMKRKQEQGSMQLQGEVQELAIEEWLTAKFPLDTITEIKKGVKGGDCLQTVHTHNRQYCGIIYYESKRTKDFQNCWIEKFKDDIREKGADIGVLVTEVLPAGMDRMGLKDGVWVCTFDEFKSLCYVLRETIIRINTVTIAQENKGDKMQLLYDYLTSKTFAMQIEAIVEGFSQLKSDMEAEKRAMQRIWKQREKQIEKVICNTIDMYGEVRGIAGNAIPEVKALELPAAESIIEE